MASVGPDDCVQFPFEVVDDEVNELLPTPVSTAAPARGGAWQSAKLRRLELGAIAVAREFEAAKGPQLTAVLSEGLTTPKGMEQLSALRQAIRASPNGTIEHLCALRTVGWNCRPHTHEAVLSHCSSFLTLQAIFLDLTGALKTPKGMEQLSALRTAILGMKDALQTPKRMEQLSALRKAILAVDVDATPRCMRSLSTLRKAILAVEENQWTEKVPRIRGAEQRLAALRKEVLTKSQPPGTFALLRALRSVIVVRQRMVIDESEPPQPRDGGKELPLARLQRDVAKTLYAPDQPPLTPGGSWGRVPSLLHQQSNSEVEELHEAFLEELVERINEVEAMPEEERNELLAQFWKEEEIARSLEEEFDRLLVQDLATMIQGGGNAGEERALRVKHHANQRLMTLEDELAGPQVKLHAKASAYLAQLEQAAQVSRQDQRKDQVREIVAALDTNSDGELSVLEVKALFGRMLSVPAAEVPDDHPDLVTFGALSGLDAEDKIEMLLGTLEAPEVDLYHGLLVSDELMMETEARATDHRSSISIAASEHGGSLPHPEPVSTDVDEAAALLEKAGKIVQALDANGDGELSIQELKILFGRMLHMEPRDVPDDYPDLIAFAELAELDSEEKREMLVGTFDADEIDKYYKLMVEEQELLVVKAKEKRGGETDHVNGASKSVWRRRKERAREAKAQQALAKELSTSKTWRRLKINALSAGAHPTPRGMVQLSALRKAILAATEVPATPKGMEHLSALRKTILAMRESSRRPTPLHEAVRPNSGGKPSGWRRVRRRAKPLPWDREHLETVLSVLKRLEEAALDALLEEQIDVIQNIRGEVPIPIRIKQLLRDEPPRLPIATGGRLASLQVGLDRHLHGLLTEAQVVGSMLRGDEPNQHNEKAFEVACEVQSALCLEFDLSTRFEPVEEILARIQAELLSHPHLKSLGQWKGLRQHDAQRQAKAEEKSSGTSKESTAEAASWSRLKRADFMNSILGPAPVRKAGDPRSAAAEFEARRHPGVSAEEWCRVAGIDTERERIQGEDPDTDRARFLNRMWHPGVAPLFGMAPGHQPWCNGQCGGQCEVTHQEWCNGECGGRCHGSLMDHVDANPMGAPPGWAGMKSRGIEKHVAGRADGKNSAQPERKREDMPRGAFATIDPNGVDPLPYDYFVPPDEWEAYLQTNFEQLEGEEPGRGHAWLNAVMASLHDPPGTPHGMGQLSGTRIRKVVLAEPGLAQGAARMPAAAEQATAPTGTTSINTGGTAIKNWEELKRGAAKGPCSARETLKGKVSRRPRVATVATAAPASARR